MSNTKIAPRGSNPVNQRYVRHLKICLFQMICQWARMQNWSLMFGIYNSLLHLWDRRFAKPVQNNFVCRDTLDPTRRWITPFSAKSKGTLLYRLWWVPLKCNSPWQYYQSRHSWNTRHQASPWIDDTMTRVPLYCTSSNGPKCAFVKGNEVGSNPWSCRDLWGGR